MWWIQFILNQLSVCHIELKTKRAYKKSNFQYHLQIITLRCTGLQAYGWPLLSLQDDSLALVPESLLLAPFALTSSCGTQIHQNSSVSQQQDIMVFRSCDVHNRETLENITLKLTLRNWVFSINFSMHKSQEPFWHLSKQQKNGLWRFPLTCSMQNLNFLSGCRTYSVGEIHLQNRRFWLLCHLFQSQL